jgi:hypothetical protein
VEVEELPRRAAAAHEAEDALYDKGKRGNELPGELARRKSRLNKSRAAKEELETSYGRPSWIQSSVRPSSGAVSAPSASEAWGVSDHGWFPGGPPDADAPPLNCVGLSRRLSASRMVEDWHVRFDEDRPAVDSAAGGPVYLEGLAN